jgi:hypothetical protein
MPPGSSRICHWQATISRTAFDFDIELIPCENPVVESIIPNQNCIWLAWITNTPRGRERHDWSREVDSATVLLFLVGGIK